MPEDVLVIGGGVAGIQASLDLADMGVQVYLVERALSIGGRMAQLDKTFPTNDCSICILAPKMADCFGHPNITVLTHSEVKEVRGSAGGFRVRVVKRPRYVDEQKCTGCGICVEKCPVRNIPDEFNMGLGTRKAAYIYFSQGVPRVAALDAAHCVWLTRGEGRCGACQKFCQRGAIEFEQREVEMELHVAAIVVATGFQPYDPSDITEYGYQRLRNVITSLEYERLICANGPTGGHLVRPSDEKPCQRLGFIQCVGSRDLRHRAYCSSVCCMHSIKEAMMAKEHDAHVRSHIFYTDMRAVGKGFQEYAQRGGEEYNTTYIRGKVAEVLQDAHDDLLVWYEDTETRQVKNMGFDLVILATSLVPSRGVRELADTLAIELDEYDFIATDPFAPTDTTRPGVFACGYCQGPLDIPESVAQASGAAARAAEVAFC